jgi:hypothetical protein
MATTDDILDLLRRVEALEARAATEQSSATDVDSALLRTGMVTARHLATIKESLTVEPAPAPAADRPLWEVMSQARYSSVGARMGSVRLATAAEIDAVAEWLDARGSSYARDVLRAEARRAREGA